MRLAVRGFLSVSPMFQPRYARAFMPAPVCGAAPARSRAGQVPCWPGPSLAGPGLAGTGLAGYCDVVTEQHQAGPVRVTKAGTAGHQGYPGADLGFAEAGQGAIAGMARRVGAIFIDWLVCTFMVVALIRPQHAQVEYWTLAIFAAQDFVFTWLTGFTLGKLVLRIRVVSLGGGMIGPGWALVRTLLLLCVIPPLITDRDVRGLHDRAANTAVVRV